MKVIALADTHGVLPKVESCDLLIIAGDVCPVEGSHDPVDQAFWLQDEFANWLEGLDADEIIGIAGNHDFALEEYALGPDLPWTYLQDSETEYKGLKIWGSPWVPNLPSWAFHADAATLRDKWALIPDDTDILVTHGPPNGVLDQCGPKYGSLCVGCAGLRARVTRIYPRLHIFGHIHEAHGTFKPSEASTEFANVAIMNENYVSTWDPTTFEIN